MSYPTERCGVCGSRMFYLDDYGSVKCAKHEPAMGSGHQYFVTKSVSKQLEFTELPTDPCLLCGGIVFWRSNTTGKWKCAEHDFPMDADDVAEAVNIRTGERVEGTPTKTGEEMDYNKLAKSINQAYGTKLTAKEVQEIAEKAMAEAVTEAKDEVWSGLAGTKGGGSSLLAPHPGEMLGRSMTGSTSAEKSARTLPATGRDFHGRRRRQAELNRGGDE